MLIYFLIRRRSRSGKRPPAPGHEPSAASPPPRPRPGAPPPAAGRSGFVCGYLLSFRHVRRPPRPGPCWWSGRTDEGQSSGERGGNRSWVRLPHRREANVALGQTAVKAREPDMPPRALATSSAVGVGRRRRGSWHRLRSAPGAPARRPFRIARIRGAPDALCQEARRGGRSRSAEAACRRLQTFGLRSDAMTLGCARARARQVSSPPALTLRVDPDSSEP